VVPTKFMTLSLYITQVTHMSEDESFVQRVMELQELDETMFLAYFHQIVDKSRKKAC
jgi:hypothetical protein